jgi:hypothetical protein
MSYPRLGALSNNRLSGGIEKKHPLCVHVRVVRSVLRLLSVFILLSSTSLILEDRGKRYFRSRPWVAQLCLPWARRVYTLHCKYTPSPFSFLAVLLGRISSWFVCSLWEFEVRAATPVADACFARFRFLGRRRQWCRPFHDFPDLPLGQYGLWTNYWRRGGGVMLGHCVADES